MIVIPIGPILAAGSFLGKLFKKGRQHAGALGDVGQVIGGVAEGRRAGQLSERDARQRLFEILSQQAAQQAQFGLAAPEARFRQALRGSAAANMQDVGVNVPAHLQRHLTTFTGGERPSAIGAAGQQAGQNLAQIGLTPPPQIQFPAAPSVRAESSSRGGRLLDRILGIAGGASSLIGALGSGDDNESGFDPNIINRYIDRRQGG